jgi:predicted nucleic acid-binding protein
MKNKSFLDTNVLVYAYDRHDPRKQVTAQALLTEAIEHESAVLSVQVLGEFFNVVTRQIKQPMTTGEAQGAVSLLSHLPVQDIDLELVKRAIATHKMYRISYWDALIVAAAERAQCKLILTEDLSDGQTYHGVLVSNPFKE